MKFTDAQRKALLALGDNPDQIELDSQEPEQALTPPVVNTSDKSKEGAFGAGVRSFAAGAAPAVAGGYSAGAVAGAVSPWAIAAAPETMGLSLLAIPASAALAGYAGGKVTSEAQKALMPPAWQQQLQEDQQLHPTATAAGSLATLPLGGLNPSAPNAIKALGTVAKLPANLIKGLPLAASESGNLANVATGAALNPAMDLATSAMEGRDTPSAGDLAKSALIGSLFNKPNALGIKYGFHPSPVNARDATTVPAQTIPDITPPINNQDALATVGRGALNTTDARPIVETRVPAEQDLLTAEQRKATPVNPVASPASIDASLPPAIQDTPAARQTIVDAIQNRVNLEDANAKVSEGIPITAGKPEQAVIAPEKVSTEPTQDHVNSQINEASRMANNQQLPLATRIAAQEQLNSLRTTKVGELPAQPTKEEPLIQPVSGRPVVNEPSKTTKGVLSDKVPLETAAEKAANFTAKFQKVDKNKLSPETRKTLRLIDKAIKDKNWDEMDRLIDLVPNADKNTAGIEAGTKADTSNRPFAKENLNSPESQARLMALAEQHGVKLAKDASIGDDNAGVIFRDSAQDTLARLHPDNAKDDTAHHEMLHALFSYMKNSNKSGFRELAKRGEELFGGEEPFVQASGEDALARFNQDKGYKAKLKEWYKDFKSTWKFALNKASRVDLANLMSHYQLHDSNTQASYGKTPFGAASATAKNQPSDKARYDDLVSQFKAAKTVEEKFNIQKQIEALKNANGGMPPKEEPVIQENNKQENYRNHSKLISFADQLNASVEDKVQKGMELWKQSGLKVGDKLYTKRGTEVTIDNAGLSVSKEKEPLVYGKAKDKDGNEYSSSFKLNELLMDNPTAKFQKTSFNPFKSEIDKIKDNHDQAGKVVADAFTKFYESFTDLKGHLSNDVISKLRSHLNLLNPKELALNDNESMRKVVDYLDDKSDGVTPKVSLNTKEQEIVKIIKEANLRSLAEKNKRPTLSNTIPDPEYFPHVVGRKQLNTLLNSPTSPEAAKLIKDFYDYQMNHLGNTQAEADENLNTLRAGYKGGDKNLAAQFGPIDKSAGVGIPKSWRETNLLDRMSRFSNRYARRLAYHDTIETNPAVTDALDNAKTGISQAKEVKFVMDDIAGKRDFEEAKRDAVSGVVRAGMMGPLTGINDFATNITLSAQHQDPRQVIPALKSALVNFKQNMEGSFRSGVNIHNIGTLEFGDGGIDNVTQILRRSRDILNVVQGRTHLEQATRATSWGIGKFLAMDNLYAAKTGKLTSQGEKFLNDFASQYDWKNYKATGQFPPDVLDKVAARFVESVQGTYDNRGLPAVAQRGSLSPILSIAKWNIEKFNNFQKYNIEPLKQGNVRPLLMSTVGALLGGAAINAIVSTVVGKKQKSPEWQEIMSSQEKLKGFTYKAAALASLSGYAGIMGDLAKSAMDVQFKNRLTGYNNPLIEGISEGVGLVQDMPEALKKGELDVSLDTAGKILETYFQSYRIALRLASEEKQKENAVSDKMRDLKMFKNLNGYPVNEPTLDTPNQFINKEERKFKRTEDPQEAVKLVPTLVEQAWKKSNGNPALFKSTLQGLKSNPYETMPDIERDPLSFMQYRKYILDTQGEEAANKLMLDYYKKNTFNKAKASLIPSL